MVVASTPRACGAAFRGSPTRPTGVLAGIIAARVEANLTHLTTVTSRSRLLIAGTGLGEVVTGSLTDSPSHRAVGNNAAGFATCGAFLALCRAFASGASARGGPARATDVTGAIGAATGDKDLDLVSVRALHGKRAAASGARCAP